MDFKIYKRVKLDFLGERYKDSYIDVEVIAMDERDKVLAELEALGNDESKSFEYVKNLIVTRLGGGSLKDGDNDAVAVTRENMLRFPAEVFIKALAQLQGQADPKV